MGSPFQTTNGHVGSLGSATAMTISAHCIRRTCRRGLPPDSRAMLFLHQRGCGVFVESFFTIPDEDVESKLHFQSPWLLRLTLDHAKIINRKISMQYVAGRIAESFKTDLFMRLPWNSRERHVRSDGSHAYRYI